MQFPRGEIIAFEGLDCSFKETNFKQFVDYLKCTYPKESKQGLITASFPRYNESSCFMVKEYLDNKINSARLRVNYSDAVCSFYSIDRLHFWNQFYPYRNIQLTNLDIRRIPSACFVFDRYSLSNAIYNPDNGECITRDDIIKEKEKFGNPLPTILVWFRMRDRQTYLNILNNKSGKDFNESDVDFMATVWDRTNKFFKSHILEDCDIIPVIIECLDENLNIRSKEDIFKDVLDGVQKAIDMRECGYNIDMPPKPNS